MITAKEILIFSYLTKLSIILTLVIVGIIAAAIILIVHYLEKAEFSEEEQKEELYAR